MSEREGTGGERGPVLRTRFHRVHGRHVELRREALPASTPRDPTRRPAYVARLLALAHQLRCLLERGEVSSMGELARRLDVSQPRVTQILNLTYMAPSIQAEVLVLEAVNGVEPMTERPLREVVKAAGWGEQRGRWRRCCVMPGAKRAWEGRQLPGRAKGAWRPPGACACPPGQLAGAVAGKGFLT